ncbi:Terminase small subunit [Rhizobium leguminosarum]|uniref:terminase small subunit n=1 Tax=Rhizobium leguminosarum TaxID=384 RepID=UPI001C97712F|nr:terminase small subunit [Rhizobium leguminosarum]MBY5541115.1 Terminase small subunit [Rhizobium leguminosarum]
MPPLSNQRREGFCRAIVRGESASGAYACIYHVSGRTAEVNGSKLLRNTAVSERIAELQGTAAKRTTKTVESLVADLDETIAFARECRNPTAMVAAINTQAKLLGLMVDRSELTVMNKPAPLPTKVLELSEEEWTAQFSTSRPGPKPALAGSKRNEVDMPKANGDAIAWDADTASIRRRGVIELD